MGKTEKTKRAGKKDTVALRHGDAEMLPAAPVIAVPGLGRDCSDEELHEWILRNVGLNIPTKAVCEGHDAPFEYVKAAFREEGDLVVWAPRGGGKTTMAALVTLLDALFKPGCEIRILGGSEQQTLAMWERFWPMLEKCAGEGMVKRARERGGEVWLKNGSSVRILQQSQSSVRGQRVQKLRCDEAERGWPALRSSVPFVPSVAIARLRDWISAARHRFRREVA